LVSSESFLVFPILRKLFDPPRSTLPSLIPHLLTLLCRSSLVTVSLSVFFFVSLLSQPFSFCKPTEARARLKCRALPTFYQTPCTFSTSVGTVDIKQAVTAHQRAKVSSSPADCCPLSLLFFIFPPHTDVKLCTPFPICPYCLMAAWVNTTFALLTLLFYCFPFNFDAVPPFIFCTRVLIFASLIADPHCSPPNSKTSSASVLPEDRASSQDFFLFHPAAEPLATDLDGFPEQL